MRCSNYSHSLIDLTYLTSFWLWRNKSPIIDVRLLISLSLSTGTSLATTNICIINDIHLAFSFNPTVALLLFSDAVHAVSTCCKCVSAGVYSMQWGFFVGLSLYVSLCSDNEGPLSNWGLAIFLAVKSTLLLSLKLLVVHLHDFSSWPMTGQSDHTFDVCAAVAKHRLVIQESVRCGSSVRSILCVQPLVTLC